MSKQDPRNFDDRRGGVFKTVRGERVRDEKAKTTTPVVPGVDPNFQPPAEAPAESPVLTPPTSISATDVEDDQ